MTWTSDTKVRCVCYWKRKDLMDEDCQVGLENIYVWLNFSIGTIPGRHDSPLDQCTNPSCNLCAYNNNLCVLWVISIIWSHTEKSALVHLAVTTLEYNSKEGTGFILLFKMLLTFPLWLLLPEWYLHGAWCHCAGYGRFSLTIIYKEVRGQSENRTSEAQWCTLLLINWCLILKPLLKGHSVSDMHRLSEAVIPKLFGLWTLKKEEISSSDASSRVVSSVWRRAMSSSTTENFRSLKTGTGKVQKLFSLYRFWFH